MFAPPSEIATEVFARLPDSLRDRRKPDFRGAPRDSFLEGPAVDRQGNFYCVDLANGRILRVAPDGAFSAVAEYDGQPNGLKIHRDGRIFVADNRRGIVAVDPASGRVTPVVEAFRFEPFRGPNDLVFARNGDLYFTDPGQGDLRNPYGRVFRLRADGVLELLLEGLAFPNGIALSPDDTLLYVAATRENRVWRAGLLPDGSLTRVSVFLNLSGGLSGPDGLAVDEAGNLAIAHSGFGTVWLVSRLGEPIHRIRSCAGLLTTNVAYGGPDRRTLYITESEQGVILKAVLPVAGHPLYSHA